MPKSQPADSSGRDRDGEGRAGGGFRKGPGGRGSGGQDGGAQDGRRLLVRYAGLASELAIAVGVSVWVGIEADKHLKLSFPIFSWVVPLLVIVVLLVQLIKANSGNKK